jgi:hypothetical protein
MAKLPNMKNASIRREKIERYLLSFDHPTSRGKARFFRQFGFTLERWSELQNALLDHAAQNEVRQENDNDFGRKYVVEGRLNTPDGRRPFVRAIWFVENTDVPVFVTAYPCKES